MQRARENCGEEQGERGIRGGSAHQIGAAEGWVAAVRLRPVQLAKGYRWFTTFLGVKPDDLERFARWDDTRAKVLV